MIIGGLEVFYPSIACSYPRNLVPIPRVQISASELDGAKIC